LGFIVLSFDVFLPMGRRFGAATAIVYLFWICCFFFFLPIAPPYPALDPSALRVLTLTPFLVFSSL